MQCSSKAAADQLQAALDAAVAGAAPAAVGPGPGPGPGGKAPAGANGLSPAVGVSPSSNPASDRSSVPVVEAEAANGEAHEGGAACHSGRQDGPSAAAGALPSPLLPPPSPGGPAVNTSAPYGGVGGGIGGSGGGGGASGSAPGAAELGGGHGVGPGPPWTAPRSPLLGAAQTTAANGGAGAAAAGAAAGAGAGPAAAHTGGPSPQRPPHCGAGAAAGAGGSGTGDGPHDGPQDGQNHFDRKICRASSDMYFHYYGMLQHQQNMLQDYTRTGTYWQAIVGNPDDFRGRVVMDVGAGSGILSLFAAQAGAARVYAVEASGMAAFARRLADANPQLGSRITVINAKVEEVKLPERVDVLVSEPMGTLLVNERMLETYVFARDAFLKPGGKMFPQLGRIHAAAFSDEVLHSEIAAKSAFWLQPSFYGVDVTALHGDATEGYFGQVVVDAFDPSVLVSSCASRLLDFGSVGEGELLDIDMNLQLMTGPVAPLTIHGLACWFDVFFAGSQLPVWLTTAPGMPTTHWFQLRCVLQTPLRVTQPHARLSGRLHLVAHERQSYDIYLTLTAPPLGPGQPPQSSSGKFDLKEPYYRQLTPYGAAAAAAGAGAAGGAGPAGAADAGMGAAAGGVAGGMGWGW